MNVLDEYWQQKIAKTWIFTQWLCASSDAKKWEKERNENEKYEKGKNLKPREITGERESHCVKIHVFAIFCCQYSSNTFTLTVCWIKANSVSSLPIVFCPLTVEEEHGVVQICVLLIGTWYLIILSLLDLSWPCWRYHGRDFSFWRSHIIHGCSFFFPDWSKDWKKAHFSLISRTPSTPNIFYHLSPSNSFSFFISFSFFLMPFHFFTFPWIHSFRFFSLLFPFSFAFHLFN